MIKHRFTIALLLVTLTGFISLSYEICWVRLYSFASASKAWAFGSLLGSYLIGLALGSWWSLKFQDHKDGSNPKHLKSLAGFVLLANIVGFLLLPLVSWLVVYVHFTLTLPLVVFAAALLGATLPLICHFAIPADAKSGARLSYLYLGNIIGSGIGSLLTGFWLMHHYSLQQISVILVVLGLALSFGLILFSGFRGRALLIRGGITLALGILAIATAPKLFDGFYERLQFKKDYDNNERFQLVMESRFGVITIDQRNQIYGGGIFDGYLGTGLEPGGWMVRPYFLSAVHESPKRVLVIGLSGGTWTQILAHNPHVEEIVAVEINGAYAEKIIPEFDAVKSILGNPKLTIVTDDGRRWLKKHPDEKFDAIVMNATYHWREHTTNLLSREFMEVAKEHLNPGGIFQFNATGSDRVALTAATVFDDSHLLLNNVIASNEKIVLNKDRWRATLEAYEIDGKPLFEDSPEGKAKIEEIVSITDNLGDRHAHISERILTKEQMLEDGEGKKIVTDDNLGHEYEWR
ncbi:methyltransferase [Akkermansiaceae bacterium]|nr:methyltransferase [Akkermansiaceae bacterium]MDB4525602.1 methyltransferase [Akkermansiaceae bacterium]MDB4546794.1 methyltransferase [Akkermansiaceae bacterium]